MPRGAFRRTGVVSVNKGFRRLVTVGAASALLATIFLPMSASAHERRTIAGGKYDVVVGWNGEPALLGQPNAALIRISKAGTNPAEPIEGADKTLKVQVKQGATTKEFPLRAMFGQQGTYVADLIPTRAGDYQFTFTGKIGDDTINEMFDSADGKFDGIKATTEMQFPVAQGDPAVLASGVQAAQAEAQNARTMAMIGIGVGILGLLAAVAAWATRGRAAPSTARAAGSP